MRATDALPALAGAAGAIHPSCVFDRARRRWLPVVALLIVATTRPVEAVGDPEAGARVFRVCAACHTLQPGAYRTGPSLAGVFGRRAGTAAGFHRYSEALSSVDLVWREDTLDAFLADPQGFLPGNRMTFRGIEEQLSYGAGSSVKVFHSLGMGTNHPCKVFRGEALRRC